MFTYVQPNAINWYNNISFSLIDLASERKIGSSSYIKGDVTYDFFTSEH